MHEYFSQNGKLSADSKLSSVSKRKKSFREEQSSNYELYY